MRRRLEERELRSLERKSMLSIFRPLDPHERPSGDSADPIVLGLKPGDPAWKSLISLLWMPALLALVTFELWLQVPQLPAWIAVITFCFAYTTLAWLIYRRG